MQKWSKADDVREANLLEQALAVQVRVMVITKKLAVQIRRDESLDIDVISTSRFIGWCNAKLVEQVCHYRELILIEKADHSLVWIPFFKHNQNQIPDENRTALREEYQQKVQNLPQLFIV